MSGEDELVIQCTGCGKWTRFAKYYMLEGFFLSNFKPWFDAHSRCHPEFYCEKDSELFTGPGELCVPGFELFAGTQFFSSDKWRTGFQYGTDGSGPQEDATSGPPRHQRVSSGTLPPESRCEPVAGANNGADGGISRTDGGDAK